MITDELNEKVVNYIIKDVETTINRLGINATLFIRKDENYKGEPSRLCQCFSRRFTLRAISI